MPNGMAARDFSATSSPDALLGFTPTATTRNPAMQMAFDLRDARN